MLSDIMKPFKKMYEKKGDKLIVDSYIPDDGEYIIVSFESEPFKVLDRVNVKFDKEIKDIERTNKYIDFICYADYYSKYLNSNKSVADKNIHSNNYLSFYTRVDPVQKNKLNDKVIEKYYDYFRFPDLRLKGKAEEERLLYKEYEEEYGQVDINKVNRAESWVKDNLFNLIDFENNQGAYKKTFIRILFYDDLSQYKKEGNRYFVTRIYNTNTYNIKINDSIYGLPDNNIGLNDKKPYLKNLTRKTNIPYYLSQKNVLMQKKLFEYLSNQFEIGKRNLFVSENEIISMVNDDTLKRDFNGIFFRIKKGKKEIEIEDYDNIVNYKYNIKPINFQNVLNLKSEKSKVVYGEIKTIDLINNTINKIFFNKYLTNNYFTEVKDIKIKDSQIKKAIIQNRNSLFTWFYKGVDKNIWKSLDKSSTELVISSILNGGFIKACERFNLRISLKGYFEGGKLMLNTIEVIKEELKVKINNKDTLFIKNDEEYYFAVGQVVYYFISLSKSGNKKLSLVNPIINSKSDKKIKEELRKFFVKYNHAIDLSSRRFKNLYAMISGYEPQSKPNQDFMIAGLLHSNLIFEKSEKKDVNLNNKEEK